LDEILDKFGVTSASEVTSVMLKMEFEEYGVDNLQDYKAAIREELFKKYNVTNYADLQKARTKDRFEERISNADIVGRKVSLSDVNYYVSSFQGFGWKNIDAFSKMNESSKTNFELKEKPLGETVLRLVFEDYNIIAPISNVEKGNFLAVNFPKRAKAWVVGINVNEDGLFLAKQKFTIDGSTVELQFVRIEPKDLRKELELLN
jgi:hypothetical protein